MKQTMKQNMEQNVKPIEVWKFQDAPEELRNLSDHGGDEDWLAIIPPQMNNKCISWMQEGTYFGLCHVYYYDHPYKEGHEVVIGAHA